MRAAVFSSATRKLAVTEVADPVPGEGQVVIKVHRCGICGSDLHMAEDHRFRFDDGAIPGHEVSGEVVALGPGVERVRVGDHVAVMPFLSCGQCLACLGGDPMGCRRATIFGSGGATGGYAEYLLTNDLWCVGLPRSLSFEDGALIEPMAVSLRAARVSGIRTGDRVLVLGAGAIGLAAAYWARRAGAGSIAVSATSRRRESMAMAIGADTFLVPEEGRRLSQQATEALGGPADIVFECAGMPGSLDQAVSAVRRKGAVVAPGFCWSPDQFSPMKAAMKEATITFTNVYDTREFEIAVKSFDQGHVEPRAMVTKVVDLDSAPEAFEELRGRNEQCKVQISPF
ncbi:alcohol dehydrogenase catalytic domain-containing protein [Sphingobium sp. Sx8-8]|uniref:zinc-dependent alcohol dehydrogenase n=1 Tax=Sphingobium sp. Sx8-8 TaxID=2933617 RepID=UPI001F5A11AC|nr:alcohol dehydrogenase catalytic domain-containing protein [Sphingobium sp. Sx8-8]